MKNRPFYSKIRVRENKRDAKFKGARILIGIMYDEEIPKQES